MLLELAVFDVATARELCAFEVGGDAGMGQAWGVVTVQARPATAGGCCATNFGLVAGGLAVGGACSAGVADGGGACSMLSERNLEGTLCGDVKSVLELKVTSS